MIRESIEVKAENISPTLNREIHLSALIGPGLALLNFILSPEFLDYLPDKYAHLGYAIATIISVVAPQLMKKRSKEEVVK